MNRSVNRSMVKGVESPVLRFERCPYLSWLASLAVYSLFAAVVFAVHGAEPPLMADHLAYMRQADEIMRAHPDGEYWRSVNQTQSYGVLLAYLYEWTGSHIFSMKLFLAAMTVISLLVFELLIGLVSTSKWQSVLFALLSGLFVTFGASFWGYTDFTASVQRTAMIPITLVAVWFWLVHRDRPWRFLVFPVLVALSVVHLSAYYTIVVLGLAELWDWGVRRGRRLDRDLGWFVASFLASYVVRIELDRSGLLFFKSLIQLVMPSTGPVLDPATAWSIELMAFPWRNMPLPVTTIALIVASYGAIGVLAVASALRVGRRGFTRLDRLMLVFAGATVLFAYGPQTLFWIARQFSAIYPISLEETRTINLILIPSLYFACRLFGDFWAAGRRRAGLAVVMLLVLQPLTVVRLLPASVRQGIVAGAVSSGLIKDGDSLRLLTARQLLGLEETGPRFYYSARGALEWLKVHTPPGTRVVSALNELVILDVERIGAFNGFLDIPVASPKRKAWADSVVDVNRAITSHNLSDVLTVARKYDATLAVVPWLVHDADYQDEHYSVVRIAVVEGR